MSYFYFAHDHALQRFRSVGLHTAFHTWAANVLLLGTVRWVLRRWSNRLLTLAWLQWMALHDDARQQKQREEGATRILRRLTNRTMAKCFDCWVTHMRVARAYAEGWRFSKTLVEQAVHRAVDEVEERRNEEARALHLRRVALAGRQWLAAARIQIVFKLKLTVLRCKRQQRKENEAAATIGRMIRGRLARRKLRTRKPGRGELRPPAPVEDGFLGQLVIGRRRAAGKAEQGGRYSGHKLAGHDPVRHTWLHAELVKKSQDLHISTANDTRRSKALLWFCILLSEEQAQVLTPAVRRGMISPEKLVGPVEAICEIDGVLPALVKFLRLERGDTNTLLHWDCEPSPQEQALACWAITNLSANPASVPLLNDAGALPLLLAVLECEPPGGDMSEQAMWALTNMLSVLSADHTDMMLDRGLLPMYLKHMLVAQSPDSPDPLNGVLAVGDGWYYHSGRNSARALSSICTKLAQRAARAVEMLPMLAYFAEEHDTQVLMFTFDALATLSWGGIEQIRSLQAARPPAGLVTQRERDLASAAATTEADALLATRPSAKPSAAELGIVPRCVELLQSPTLSVKLRALVIIGNVCSANSFVSTAEDRHIESVMQGGQYGVDALAELLQLLQSDDVKTRRLVLRVIANMLAGNPSQVARVLSLDCTSGTVTCGRFVPLLFKIMAGVPTHKLVSDPSIKNPPFMVSIGEREEATRSICNATWAEPWRVERLIEEGALWAIIAALVWGLTGKEDVVPADIDVVGRGGRPAKIPSETASDTEGRVLLPAMEALSNLLKHQVSMTVGEASDDQHVAKKKQSKAKAAAAVAAGAPKAASAWELRVKAQRGWVDEKKAEAQDIRTVLMKHSRDWATATSFWSGAQVAHRWRWANTWASTGSVRRGTELVQALLFHENPEVGGVAAKILRTYFNWTEDETQSELVADRTRKKADAIKSESDAIKNRLAEYKEALAEEARVRAAAERFGQEMPAAATDSMLSDEELTALSMRLFELTGEQWVIEADKGAVQDPQQLAVREHIVEQDSKLLETNGPLVDEAPDTGTDAETETARRAATLASEDDATPVPVLVDEHSGEDANSPPPLPSSGPAANIAKGEAIRGSASPTSKVEGSKKAKWHGRVSARNIDDASLAFIGRRVRPLSVTANTTSDRDYTKLDNEDATKVLTIANLLRSKSGSKDFHNVTSMLDDLFS
eukprot:SAG31_NODE_2732_length_5173_cov_18.479306_2_plen_1195_part_00